MLGSPWIEPVRSIVVESPAAIRNSSICKFPIRPESWDENPIEAFGLFFIGKDGTKKSRSKREVRITNNALTFTLPDNFVRAEWNCS